MKHLMTFKRRKSLLGKKRAIDEARRADASQDIMNKLYKMLIAEIESHEQLDMFIYYTAWCLFGICRQGKR